MPGTVYLSHPSSLQHDTGPHPERAERMVAIERELAATGWLGLERVASAPADRALLERVHTPAHVDLIERISAHGGAQLDPDTVVSAGSWAAALHAAGGAAELVDLLLDGSASFGLSVHRPPGHHAEADRAMGFCLFNNVAVAAAHALADGDLERVLVLDWDVHHGNGTNDIFHSNAAVLYASIHESPLYPGTGPAADIGSGDGEGYTLNLPVPAGSGDACFTALIEYVVVPVTRVYQPQLVLVSAGFDAHAEDPLAGCQVTESGYAVMTSAMRRVCAELEVPLGIVLEGGYALGALARSVRATVQELVTPQVRAAEEVALHPLAAAARERVAERWSLHTA